MDWGEVQEIRATHRATGNGSDTACVLCRTAWPCPPLRAAWEVMREMGSDPVYGEALQLNATRRP